MIIKKLVLTLLILFFTVGIVHAEVYGDVEDADYIGNFDGDTITFNLIHYPDIIGKHIRVRVEGLDTPEIKGKCENEILQAKVLKKYVHDELSEADVIKIVHVQRDKYFRILGDIVYDGKSLKETLLKHPAVYPYDGGTKIDHWCK